MQELEEANEEKHQILNDSGDDKDQELRDDWNKNRMKNVDMFVSCIQIVLEKYHGSLFENYK